MAAVAFTSCNANDDSNENEIRAVRFTAGIGKVATPQGSPETRAAGTTWGSGDAIGIFMVANGSTTVVENAANKQYTATGINAFTAAAGNEIYYPMDGSKVDFIAYYPYNSSNTTLSSIDVTIGDQTVQSAFDLLWAKADNAGAGYDKVSHATASVAMEFSHKLAKIVMNTTADASVGTALTGMTVKIKGMNTQNTFDLATGQLGATPETVADIIPHAVTDGSVYDAIIMPGSYGAGTVTVEFTVGGEIFTWNVGAMSFDGGNEYTYDVKLTRTGVRVTGTITPWTPVSGGDQVAN